MAEIRPFKGFYYDGSKVDPQKVVTQPWDVITPEMQQKYYDADPHNIVRIIRGRDIPGDNENENKFARAGRHFREWLSEDIFVRDAVDSIYLYTQKFRLGESDCIRRGLVAAVQLEDYESKIILPHEHTFAHHSADRLHLLRETKANFGQIFVLYSDPEMAIAHLLARYDAAPRLMTVGADGITHSVVRITDPDDIAFIVKQFKHRQLFIADGHHRYRTALNYRDEMAPKLSEKGRQEVGHRMMTLVNMDDPSLTILPTHRAVRGIADFQREPFLRQLDEFFAVQPLPHDASDLRLILRRLREVPPTETAFVVCLPGENFSLAALRDRAAANNAFPQDMHPLVRELDVTVLHSLILENMLGLTRELQASGEYIRYYRDPAEAVALLERGEAQVAFLLNPTRVRQVRDVALAGQVMPHKSTDFYPKLLTGLIMRKLDV